MSIATEITRLQTLRNKLRNVLVNWGLVTSTATLDSVATALEGVTNQGSVTAQVKEGQTYTIPKGYHNGSGTVSGVAGGGNYILQSKSITPTKAQQNVVPDSGYFGLSDVTVAPIPEAYQDVSDVTAGAADVLANKVIVDATGKEIAGTMPNNGAVSKRLTASDTRYVIPAGYHNGEGAVDIAIQSRTVTPTKSKQTVTPGTGQLLVAVVVNAIPDNYIDTTDATADASKMLAGSTAYVNGVKVTGTMPDKGAVDVTLNPDNPEYVVPSGYHNGSGKVAVEAYVENSFTPSKEAQIFDDGYYYNFTIEPIPDNFISTDDADATSDDILNGRTAYVNGERLVGTMDDNSGELIEMDGLTTAYVTIPKGYHDGTSRVSLTDDIEDLLAEI